MTYIKRNIDQELSKWKVSLERKPILLRGARQVGKSSTVKELGKQFKYFLEVNFDEKPDVKVVFEKDLTPQRICEELSSIYGIPIISGETLLFLDETQGCLPAISSLRYFYEKMPELHVIAAGSLLEFALGELPSFGVGRVRSLFLYPFSFDEYLRAIGAGLLADALLKARPEAAWGEAVHKKCMEHLVRFISIGGMPEVVAAYANGRSLLDCQQILDDLILSLYDDFAKYKKRVPVSRLREVFKSVIEQTGSKFIYSKVENCENQKQVKESLELLELAGIIYPVVHSSSNGIPLGAEINPKLKKYLILDTGIFQRFLKLNIGDILISNTLEQVNKGAIAELFAGLEMIKSAPSNNPMELYYWHREKKGSEAEVDYVIQEKANIIPVEIKSGTKGSMQSLFRFLEEKNTPYGIRSSLENFGVFNKIKIIPLYAISSIIQK